MMRILGAAATMAVAATPLLAEQHGEDDWFPSRYGADDEIGAANLLTPEMATRPRAS